MHFDLLELWFISGRSESKSVVPVHDHVGSMEPDLIEILPAIHGLTGCGTTSKVGTKRKAIKEGNINGYSLLYNFG